MDSTVLIKDISFISEYAYEDHDEITKIVMDKLVLKIGGGAFRNNHELKEVIFSDNTLEIGDVAFENCYHIEELVLPKNLRKIGYKAFSNCKRLKKVIIPEGVTDIGYGCFAGCENLEEVYLPNSLRKLNPQMFLNCKKLKKIHLPENINYLPDEFFKGCEELDIILPDSITKLKRGVFHNCKSFTDFPNHVTEYGHSCFKNCSNLERVYLNDAIKHIPDSCFEGCHKLVEIVSNNKTLSIGKRAFRNCSNLTGVPSFVKSFSERAFENCIAITEVDINNKDVPEACFRGCINLKNVKNADNAKSLACYAFSNTGVEEFSLNTTIIAAEVLSNCKNLRRINIIPGATRIKSRAFYNCPLLEDTFLPDTIEEIGKEAYARCSSIKEFIVPANLKTLGDGAFSCMDSLEIIKVSPYNKKFISPDNKILIDGFAEKLVLYANGLKDSSYSLQDYCFEEKEESEIIRPIKKIAPYAFVGANNLKEITICSCVDEIDATSFLGCKNLVDLNISAIPGFSATQCHIRNRGMEIIKDKPIISLPFKNLKCTGDNILLLPYSLIEFTNLENINFENASVIYIQENSFNKANKLKSIFIPNEVVEIGINAFDKNVLLEFENGLKLKELQSLVSDSRYLGKYKLYTLDTDNYYIEDNDTIIQISTKDITNTVFFSEHIKKNPILFYDYMKSLKEYNLDKESLLLNGILMNTLSNENRILLLNHYDVNDEYFMMGLKYSGICSSLDVDTTHILKDDFHIFLNYIELMRKYQIKDPIMYHRILMCNYPLNNLEELIQYDYDFALTVLKKSNLLNSDDINFNANFIKDILSKKITDLETEEVNTETQKLHSYTMSCEIFNSEDNQLLKFIKLLKENNIKDSFIMNAVLISTIDNKFAKLLFTFYDANLKRLLKESRVFNDINTATDNYIDLLKLLYITGCLADETTIRQKSQTFITEKILMDMLPKNQKNDYCINGDDIHRIFNYYEPLIYDFDLEFANFFLENYHELYDEEKKKTGFIERAYLNFRHISKTSTSDKGSQRHLKVLMSKVRNYLKNTKFDNVNDENALLARFIGNWYDDNNLWMRSLIIMDEAKKAPRNIFTRIDYDEDGNPIYDNDTSKDLNEEVSDDYSYEWLPKQYKENLVLGKYCNCCAHLNGAGLGIMRASMILDCVQNLVIKDNTGDIISKITIFVNREQQYAVFNTVETSLNHKTDEEKVKIYNAFIRGTKAFVNAYNFNNPGCPLTTVTIGSNRNTIIEEFEKHNHPEHEVLQSLKFGEYSLSNSNYAGDWAHGQILVLGQQKRP